MNCTLLQSEYRTSQACASRGCQDVRVRPLLHVGTMWDRVRAGIVNSSLPWPSAQTTISLVPAALPGLGSAADLAIAVAILAAN